MSFSQIDIYRPSTSSVFDDFEEALHNQQLHFRASELVDLGFESYEEVVQSIARAIHVCNNCGVPVNKHFKMIYVADETDHTVRRDWRLSKLAYSLVMLNGAPDNPAVGHAQIEVLRQYF